MILLQTDIVSTLRGVWPLLLMFVVVYFFFIRPQSKKTKDQANFIKNLDKGDKVVTNGGIIGKISKLDNQEVTIQVDQKSYITLLRSALNYELTQSIVKES